MDRPTFFRPPPALEPYTERFWRACRAHRLEFQRCSDCARLIHPERPVCPRCLGRNLAPTVVSGNAELFSFTVNHQAWYPGQGVPYVIGLVSIAEDPEVRLTTNIIHCEIDELKIGMLLRVVFEPLNDDVALPLFEPVRNA